MVTDIDERTLLQQWLNAIKINQIGHLRAAAHYKLLGRGIGLALVVFSVAVSTSAFSSLNSSNNQIILLIVGVISLIATVLSGAQAFLNYPEIASKHQTAGVQYGRLRRRIETTIASTSNVKKLAEEMPKIRTEMDKLDSKSLLLPQRFHDEALKIVKPDIAELRGNKLD